MNKKDFLLEIGTEEIPARFIEEAAEQLKTKTEEFLKEQRVSFDAIQSFETPRRVAVLVKGLAEKQEDIDMENRGPAKKIAVDEQGNWTRAAEGFARGQGVRPDQLYFKEHKGEEYVFARRQEIGKNTTELLPAITQVIEAMHFPKNMRWGDYDLKFVRPIRWIVALYGEQVIPIELTGVSAGRKTRGHRVLGQEVEIPEAGRYEQVLKDQYVLVNPDERRQRILDQLKQLEQEQNWVIPVEEDLLDEVVHLVEYPTALYGSFEEAFLSIPQEVLVTSMREHQRYFPVRDENGNLLPHFVTVRNGDDRHLDTVARGNEKVLRARLSDARFFYEEDLKMPIEDALSKLEHVVFHEELGTIGDKARRLKDITAVMAEHLNLSSHEEDTVSRIAEICKFDLVTSMVYEFPELEGIMGEYYARHAGESEEVSRGIFEHHLPRFAGDQLPESLSGALVSIADKLDTIIGCFSIGIVPTGSQDPYALRRQAAGIVHILWERHIPLTLNQLFDSVMEIHNRRNLGNRSDVEIRRDLYDFFTLRIKNLLQDRQVRYDVIDAVLAVSIDDLQQTVYKADHLMERIQDPEFKGIVESFTRVYNLAQKAEEPVDIDPDLFEEAAEQNLYQSLNQVVLPDGRWDDESAVRALRALEQLKAPIDRFFDDVMVMVDDERLKNNRLALLKMVSDRIQQYADFNKIVFAS
ncbi:MAG: glycine--tRNA ligase subunit beta [Bacillaceae bacterium]|nr:glycine--tRNA ligase subunit beta [Bacillaceae bacterium]